MKRPAAACTLAGAALLGAAVALAAALGLENPVVVESGAHQRFDEYAAIWRSAAEPPPVVIGEDLLPPNLPGPEDEWGGNREHAITLLCDLEPGRYRLELALYEAHEAEPPKLALTHNGVRLEDVRIGRGSGKPAPYSVIDPDLAVTVPFTAAAGRNTFTLTSVAGSWLAPARVRVAGARPSLNPAKTLYLLLARPRHLAAVAGLLLGGLFLIVCARRGAREAGFAVLLVAVSVAATAVLGELVFREWLIRNPTQRALWKPRARLGREADANYTYLTMVQPSSHPEIPYEMKPLLDGMFAGHPMATNSLGMRGPELGRERRPGTVRIVGLGDSAMLGWGVSYEDTALTLIGRLLERETGRPTETANLGCPSYNTAVEAASYRLKGSALEPELVVLIFLENDFGFPGLMLEPVVRSTLRQSYLREQLRKQLVPLWRDAGDFEQARFVSTRQFDAMKGKSPEELTPQERWLLRVQEHYLHMTSQEGVRGSLKELADMIRGDGAVGVVVYNPIHLTVGDPDSREKRAGWVVATAREVGLAAVDMTPVYERHLRDAGLQRMEQGLWVNQGDWHPNAAAHRLIAETVVELVLEKGLLAAGGEQ